jgi:predicted transcriptional regulator
MIKQTIGENAGLIWQILNKNGEMQLAELLKNSNIEEADFNRSLGWLAREGKIAFYNEDDKQMAILIF